MVTCATDDDIVEYSYNEAGLMTSRGSIAYREFYEYDSERRMTRKANTVGELIDYSYDSNGRPMSERVYSFVDKYGSRYYPYVASYPDQLITKTLKSRTDYSYYSYGLMYRERSYATEYEGTEQQYVISNYVYDVTAGSRIFGALLEENNGVDHAIKYFYDNTKGTLLATVNVYDGTGTVYTYDGMGRLTGVTPATYSSSTGAYTAVTNAQSVDYTYDSRNMLSTVSTDSTTYTFTYDVWGNQSSVAIGSTTLASYEYNDVTGTLKKMTDGNDVAVSFTKTNFKYPPV